MTRQVAGRLSFPPRQGVQMLRVAPRRPAQGGVMQPGMPDRASTAKASPVVSGAVQGVDLYRQVEEFVRLDELSSLLGIEVRA